MKYTPEEVSDLTVKNVEYLNDHFPGWYKDIPLEKGQEEQYAWFNQLPLLLPPAYYHDLEVAWWTAIRMLRLMESKR